jgi:hypothetical protein
MIIYKYYKKVKGSRYLLPFLLCDIFSDRNLIALQISKPEKHTHINPIL